MVVSIGLGGGAGVFFLSQDEKLINIKNVLNIKMSLVIIIIVG